MVIACDLEACLRTQPQPKEKNDTKSRGPQETATSCAHHQSKVDLTSWWGNILELSDDSDRVDEAEMLELFWHAAMDRAPRLFWVAQLDRSVLWKCVPCPQLCSVGKFILLLWSAFPSKGSCLEALFPTWWHFERCVQWKAIQSLGPLLSEGINVDFERFLPVLRRVSYDTRVGLALESLLSWFDIRLKIPVELSRSQHYYSWGPRTVSLNKPLFFITHS